MYRRIVICLLSIVLLPLSLFAQRIPEMIEYTEVYDFLEELTTDGIIRSNAAIKPYTRDYIAALLAEAQSKDSLLTKRQKDDLQFYLQDYALELDTLPTYYSYGHRHVTQWKTSISNLNLADPSLHMLTKKKIFKMRHQLQRQEGHDHQTVVRCGDPDGHRASPQYLGFDPRQQLERNR